MDTPEKTQIGTPLSKFEESPIFSYINNLSPIKPVKSVHVTQTFNSLSFSSPLSVFASPHVSSLREARFLRSHNIADLSNPKVLSQDENKVWAKDGTNDATNTYIQSNEEMDSTDKGVLIGHTSLELPKEDTDFAIELPKELKYESGSPDCEQTSFAEYENSSLLQFPSKEVSSVASVPGAESDWKGLISDVPDLLTFDSQNDAEPVRALMHRPLDPAVRFCTIASQLSQDDITSQKPQVIDQDTSSQCITDCQSLQTRDYLNAAIMAVNQNGQIDNESIFIMHRGLRKRCLDFEMTGGQKKTPGRGSFSDSCISQSDERIATNNMQIVPSKRNADSQRCILPGIGLHLNSLASLKGYRDNKHRNLESSCSAIHLEETSQEHPLSVLTPSERDIEPNGNEAQLVEDGSQPYTNSLAEDFSQNNPTKKRCKVEPDGENEGCKRCNCKKSKCLKLYCECFAAGVYCIEPCTCQDCFNKPFYEDRVLETRKQIESRNPLAFAPKVIKSTDSVPEIGDELNKTPASARHKRGCNCKKSNCLKKYCECYQGGVGCSVNCRCEGCKNTFGTKDGSIPIGIEAEPEEKGTCDQSTEEKRLKKMDIQNNGEYLASTPLWNCRSQVPLPFSSKWKPPRSSSATRGLYAGNRLGKPNALVSQQKKKHLEMVPDDEIPDILLGDGSPVNGIKTSPNGKRVSPPHCNLAGSPTRRSGRKLLLLSIPSFPSLTQRQI